MNKEVRKSENRQLAREFVNAKKVLGHTIDEIHKDYRISKALVGKMSAMINANSPNYDNWAAQKIQSDNINKLKKYIAMSKKPIITNINTPINHDSNDLHRTIEQQKRLITILLEQNEILTKLLEVKNG